jgi:hypothetical protein
MQIFAETLSLNIVIVQVVIGSTPQPCMEAAMLSLASQFATHYLRL